MIPSPRFCIMRKAVAGISVEEQPPSKNKVETKKWFFVQNKMKNHKGHECKWKIHYNI